ncbi:MAG TPA: hypothetical protein ENG51_18075 [Deltaproteobacteria bacterium]|nr:hypothetical protein [Deltaproteobacteria bacterium]
MTTGIPVNEGSWVYVSSYKAYGKIIEQSNLWGNKIFRVWLPSTDSIVRIRNDEISTQSSVLSTPHLTYLAAAARVADALTQDVLLAPLEASVIPLPHQIQVLKRAISTDRVRFLLADEVGLGKTIEAGLIMRELKLRGLVKRTLIITPRGLLMQWIAEMDTHFNEQFYPIMSEDYRSLKRIFSLSIGNEKAKIVFGKNNLNPFCMFDQVIVSMDSVKPSEGRGGEESQVRFEDLVSANWDLVIVDEAHRLGGSTDQVARYKLGKGVAEVAPYLLLLSATPHQGKTDQFHRLISLLDPEAFPDENSIKKEQVQPYVIRTEKRRAIDAEGKPLFTPRQTELVPVSWKDHHRDQRLLYEMVTDYVREGYNQAMREKRTYIGFLMILMQRLVVSSTRAIRTTLERRLEALEMPQEQLTLFPQLGEEDWIDLDGQEQMDTLLKAGFKALKNEQAEVKILLEIAKRCESQGPDAKAEALLDWIYQLQAEEEDPELKVLVFTEFVPTQEMLSEFLTETSKEAEKDPLSHHLTLEDPRVRNLAVNIPIFAQGQPVPVITLPGLAKEIKGFWSLWRISISSEGWNQYRIIPLFLDDNGRILAPTARYIWDQLLTTFPTILGYLDYDTSHQTFEQVRKVAELYGRTIYDELVLVHKERLTQERKKAEYAFASRRKAILRIGLPQVRNYRLHLLGQEEHLFKEQLERRAQILPEMMPLLLVRVEGATHG